MEQKLIDAIDALTKSVDNLTESTDRLYAIQNDIFNVDSSHDDIISLKGRLKELIDVIERKL